MRIPELAIASLLVLSIVGTEVARSVVHRRREARTGLGGTQDIAMWGSMVTLIIAAVALEWLIWGRQHR